MTATSPDFHAKVIAVFVVICCLLVLAVVGCGTGAGSTVVANVAGRPITRGQVAHWMAITAAETSTRPGQPKPAVPQPPSYSACIAYKRRYPPTPATSPPPTRARLRAACQAEYQHLLLSALYLLIPYEWVTDEAKTLHVKANPHILARLTTLFKGQRFPNNENYDQYLAATHRTPADILTEIKLELLIDTIQVRLEEEPNIKPLNDPQAQQALFKFGAEYKQHWKTQTNCQPGYITPLCKQYKPTSTPPQTPAIPLTNLNIGDRNILGYNTPRRDD